MNDYETASGRAYREARRNGATRVEAAKAAAKAQYVASEKVEAEPIKDSDEEEGACDA